MQEITWQIPILVMIKTQKMGKEGSFNFVRMDSETTGSCPYTERKNLNFSSQGQK